MQHTRACARTHTHAHMHTAPPLPRAQTNSPSVPYTELKESDRRVLMEKIPIAAGTAGHVALDALVGLRAQVRNLPQSKDDKKREKAKEKEKKKKAKEDEVSYQLARYENRVQQILQDFMAGELSVEAFPYVGNVDVKALANEAQPVSLKSEAEGGWAGKGKKVRVIIMLASQCTASGCCVNACNHARTQSHLTWAFCALSFAFSRCVPLLQASEGPTKDAPVILGSRVILFMVGGVAYSEIRSAYEVGEQAQREVLIGKTEFHVFCSL